MGIYKLKMTDENIENALVEKIKSENIDYEKYFESWLENTPSLLFDDDENYKTVLWIGRQSTANVGNIDKFSDLIGIDSSGDLVIVELKKGKTPRDIIAQILEYASWAARLGINELDVLARNYYKNDENYAGKDLKEIFRETFDIVDDQEIIFNRNQKLYIVAEEISPVVKQVSKYLSDTFHVDINHLEYEILRTKDNDYIISVQRVLGFDQAKVNFDEHGIKVAVNRWNGDIKVKEIIRDALNKYINGDKEKTFTPSDIIHIILEKYPNANKTTIRCNIIQDCVNHTSRKHYQSGQQDTFFLINNGIYKLFDEKTDGKWDWEGKKIE